jgi:hypothetical protein
MLGDTSIAPAAGVVHGGYNKRKQLAIQRFDAWNLLHGNNPGGHPRALEVLHFERFQAVGNRLAPRVMFTPRRRFRFDPTPAGAASRLTYLTTAYPR